MDIGEDGIDDVIDRLDHSRCHNCGCVLTDENRASGGNSKRLCRNCANKMNRDYKKRRMSDENDSYREDEKKRAKQWYRGTYRKKRDELLNKYKTPCLKCGEQAMECIVFHHIEPLKKSFCVGGGALGKHREEEIASEVEKCVCLCENCHRKFHHKYFHQVDNPISALETFLREGE